MRSHTPGPWHVANGVQVRSERDQIAKVWMMRNGEGNSNARLIAAAPELYEALDGLLRVCSLHFEASGFPSTFHANAGTVDVARAALAKARGES
jgi:hypothetical protein